MHPCAMLHRDRDQTGGTARVDVCGASHRMQGLARQLDGHVRRPITARYVLLHRSNPDLAALAKSVRAEGRELPQRVQRAASLAYHQTRLGTPASPPFRLPDAAVRAALKSKGTATAALVVAVLTALYGATGPPRPRGDDAEWPHAPSKGACSPSRLGWTPTRRTGAELQPGSNMDGKNGSDRRRGGVENDRAPA
jgi:hypothetical protein